MKALPLVCSQGGPTTIRRNALAQAQLVSDLLDLSRLQMGKRCSQPATVSLSTIITDAIEQSGPKLWVSALPLNIDLRSRVLLENLGDSLGGPVAWNLLNQRSRKVYARRRRK